MPVREGRAKLWFQTKEEQVRSAPRQDEFDDLLISNIELTTDVEGDDNYCLMFNRKKKEQFLSINGKAQQELSQVQPVIARSTPSTVTRRPTSTSTWQANATTARTGTGTSRRACSAGASATSSSEKYTHT
jgi:hypothetical protein